MHFGKEIESPSFTTYSTIGYGPREKNEEESMMKAASTDNEQGSIPLLKAENVTVKLVELNISLVRDLRARLC